MGYKSCNLLHRPFALGCEIKRCNNYLPFCHMFLGPSDGTWAICHVHGISPNPLTGLLNKEKKQLYHSEINHQPMKKKKKNYNILKKTPNPKKKKKKKKKKK